MSAVIAGVVGGMLVVPALVVVAIGLGVLGERLEDKCRSCRSARRDSRP